MVASLRTEGLACAKAQGQGELGFWSYVMAVSMAGRREETEDSMRE